MHGVSSRKIKRMLDTYEHNITGQSLFAMLPPLNCGKMRSWTSDINTPVVDSAQNQYEMPAVDNLCYFTSSLSAARTDARTAHSCIASSSESTLPASVPHIGTVSLSGYVLSAGDESRSCSLSNSGTSNLVSETVGGCSGDILAAASCEMLTLPSSMLENVSESFTYCSSVDIDASRAAVVENACSAEVLLPVCTVSLSNSQDLMLWAENSAHSCSSNVETVTSPLSAEALVTIDINCNNEKSTDSFAVTSGNMHAETLEMFSASEVSELISDGSPVDEAVDVVTKDVQSKSDIISSSKNTDTPACFFTQSEFVSNSCEVSDNVHLGCDCPRAVDANTQYTLTIPLHTACMQPSDNDDTLLIPSVSELPQCSLITGSETTDSDDRGKHLLTETSDAFCDIESACSQVETLDDDLPAAETSDIRRLKHTTLDKTVECEISHEANKNIDEKYPELTIYLETEEKDTGSEVYSTDHSIYSDRATELSNKNASVSIEENLPDSVDIQSIAQSLESDRFVGNEDQVKNLEVHSAQRVAELMYWEQIDSSKRLNSPHDEAKEHCGTVDTVPPLSDSLGDQCIPGMEPKPQRTNLRSCQKKQMSSLMERIMAGKEWLSECEPYENPISSQYSSVDVAPSHSDMDQCGTEQPSVLDEYQSNSTQTEPADFVILAKATAGDEVIDIANYVAVVKTSPRVISLHLTDDQTSPNVPIHVMLHKSCSTADESESVENSSQLDLLAACFPTISSRDLQELLTNCGNDIILVADLLLEFGYEYNEPQEDFADVAAPSSSSSCSDSTRGSPDRSVAAKNSSPSIKETKSSKKNTSSLALCRLYRDSLIPKSIVTESIKIQAPYKLQVPVNLPASGLYHCILFH